MRNSEEDLLLSEGDARANAATVIVTRSVSNRKHERRCCHSPGTEHPVVTLVRVREVGGLSVGVVVVDVAIGLTNNRSGAMM